MAHRSLRALMIWPLAPLALLGVAAVAAPALTVSPAQRAQAEQVAQAGVALADLKPNAPVRYSVRRGDTLWAISGLYLRSPWQWPQLWGMNLSAIANPHRIYPGQTLVLSVRDGRASLAIEGSSPATSDEWAALPTLRLSPHTRAQAQPDAAIPSLNLSALASFLAQPLLIDEPALAASARLVAGADERVMFSRGDRIYARSASGAELNDAPSQPQKIYRVFRSAMPLKDPVSGAVLGYEAQYVGRARLERSQGQSADADAQGQVNPALVPATFDVIDAKEELRVGDHLLPEPPQQWATYAPHAPSAPVQARIVSVYGSAVANAGQNQVVTLNRGQADGMDAGMVLAILKDGARLVDKTDPSLPTLKLPDERNGLLMVFKVFERVSYALVLEIRSGVRVGDRLVNPR